MLLALAAAALLSLDPWEDSSRKPDVTVWPQVAIGVDEAVAVAAGSPAAADRPPVVAADVPRVAPATFAAAPAAPGDGGSVPRLGIAAARPVALPTPPASPPRRPPRPSPPPQPSSPVEPIPVVAPASPPAPPAAPHLIANFEEGLKGWKVGTAGNIPPRIATGAVRDGVKASIVRLSGTQSRSQLILGDEGTPVEVREGEEYAFAFSFFVQTMAYGEPGVDNMVLRLAAADGFSESLALQLWESPGVPWEAGGGLWSSGDAVGGERFLGAIEERSWHDVILHFRASGQGAGFYAVYLDGQLVDGRSEVSTIVPGGEPARIEVGLFRDGTALNGTSEIRIDAARLGRTLESVLTG
jgi:hypothetical protein